MKTNTILARDGCRVVTEVQPQMPCFFRPLNAGELPVRLFWRTDSGTGSTLVYVEATNYTDAFAGARQHFREAFAPHGYSLVTVSIN